MSASPFLLLMPSYNQAHYIVEAVRSVMAQDDPDWELWIVDNSSDSTPQVMREFTDPRIHFHHIPQRMDPGTCLNWMLQRAQGEAFSYLHTDNNLLPDYVRTFRAALQGRPLGLAHCDHRIIDGGGRCTGVHRRGSFDLPRLLSLDPLGVPFAATTELARRVGGFSVHDVADDVRFCIAAHGIADFVHVRAPIIDYRVHAASRTADTGGVSGMRAMFLKLFSRVLPELETRGLRPRQELADEVRRRLDDLEWMAEHLWYRVMSRRIPAWWRGRFRIDRLFEAGLLRLPKFTPGLDAPPLRTALGLHEPDGGRINPLRGALAALFLRLRARPLRLQADHAALLLLPWACMELGPEPGAALAFRIRGLDFRTLWAARELQASLGWIPLLDPTVTAPPWLGWDRAAGHEPLLDASHQPHFTREP